MPPDASADGHLIDWLIQVTLVFIALLFLAMVAWMLLSVALHGRKHKAIFFRGDTRRAMALPLGLAAGIFFVVDGNLFYHSTRDMHATFWNFAVKIEINAHQWAWDARYAGPDGTFNTADDVVTLNDVRVPVGAPVVVQLGAVDVIHSFYLPNFRVKIDAVPGTINRVWFRPSKVGRYEIGCAQHCGVNHYKMRGVLTVLPRAEYDAWLAGQSALGKAAYDPKNADANWGWQWKDAE
jgi:cytochrome c oxidase subunit 2